MAYRPRYGRSPKRRPISGSKAADIAVHLNEATNNAGFSERVDTDEELFRPLGGASKIELAATKRERQYYEAYWNWLAEPISRRIISILRDFTLGEGATFEAEDPIVQEIIDEHWNDPVNEWQLKQFTRIQDLSIFGVLAMPTFVNRINGAVRLGYLLPMQIEQVVSDPENAEHLTHLRISSGKASQAQNPAEPILSQTYGEQKAWTSPWEQESRDLRIVSIDEDPNSATFKHYIGDVFFFRVNTSGASSYGHSDLFHLLDWIDALDRILFDRADKTILANSFIWDVLLEGASEAEIKEWLKNNATVTPGMIRAHNNKVKWSVVSADMKAQDASIDARMLRRQILGGAGMPEMWFADGEGTTRATALSQGVPTFMMLQSRQHYIRAMFARIMQYVIDQALQHRTMLKPKSVKFKIHIPRVETADMDRKVQMLQTGANAIATARDNAWISERTAARMFAYLTSQVGFVVDPAAEIELAKGATPDADAAMATEPEPDEATPNPEPTAVEPAAEAPDDTTPDDGAGKPSNGATAFAEAWDS